MQSEPNPAAGSPPPLPPALPPQPSAGRQLLRLALNLCLALFLADAVVSLLDDSLILLFNARFLTPIRGVVFFFALLLALLVYVLMGLTPLVPKRLFLPVTLFNPVVGLLLLPAMIYAYGRLQQVSWAVSVLQLLFGLGLFYWFRGGFHVPLVPEEKLGARSFSWANLSGFLLVNVFVLLPGLAAYLFLCASLAVGHFTEGFLTLRPSGFAVQVRKYARDDGKTVQLVPMAHIGEPDFYRKLSRSFPADSLILMEGVSDSHNLLTNKVSYRRMATSLGLAEQQKEFEPTRGEVVHADVDISEFTPETLGFLNLAMLIHTRGMNAELALKLLQYSPPPEVQQQILDDLLRKRNRHVLHELQTRLPDSENIVIPWGVAHMPGIAAEVQNSGFRLRETRNYQVIRFGRKHD